MKSAFLKVPTMLFFSSNRSLISMKHSLAHYIITCISSQEYTISWRLYAVMNIQHDRVHMRSRITIILLLIYHTVTFLWSYEYRALLRLYAVRNARYCYIYVCVCVCVCVGGWVWVCVGGWVGVCACNYDNTILFVKYIIA